MAKAVRLVQRFDAFEPGNEPYREHDLGAIELGDQTLLWKIDYYGPALT